MYNYKMTIQYDGSRYDGWQRLGKDESSNTIESKIEEILHKLTGEEIEIFCGCRTEKGVHAYEQTANVKLNSMHQDYDLRNYLNRYLPRDIAVLSVESVDDRFHSQLNAKTKTYVYRLDTEKIADVFDRKYSYHTFDKPDVKAMQEAANLMIGTHDFKAFTTARKSKSTVKRVDEISIKEEGRVMLITITANDFLHNMARLIVGLLLDAGNGMKSTQDVRQILEGNSEKTWLPAESYGLFLKKITY